MARTYEALRCHIVSENLRMPVDGGDDFSVIRKDGFVEIPDHSADCIYKGTVVWILSPVVHEYRAHSDYPERFAHRVLARENGVREAFCDDTPVRG